MELSYVRSSSRRNSAFALPALFALGKITPTYGSGIAAAMTKVTRQVRVSAIGWFRLGVKKRDREEYSECDSLFHLGPPKLLDIQWLLAVKEPLRAANQYRQIRDAD